MKALWEKATDAIVVRSGGPLDALVLVLNDSLVGLCAGRSHTLIKNCRIGGESRHRKLANLALEPAIRKAPPSP